MRKPIPARYRTTNWSSYTALLRKRGSLLIWLDKDMIRRASHGSSPGRTEGVSGAAIQFCLTISSGRRPGGGQPVEDGRSDLGSGGVRDAVRRQKILTVQIRTALKNRLSAFGAAEIVRVA